MCETTHLDNGIAVNDNFVFLPMTFIYIVVVVKHEASFKKFNTYKNPNTATSTFQYGSNSFPPDNHK